MIRSPRGAAMVVTLKNLAAAPTSDLPISVGVKTAPHDRPQYLNAEPGIDYFKVHVPAIAAGGTLVWVFTTERHLEKTAKPFAVVGPPAPVGLPALGGLPQIGIDPGATTSSQTSVTIRNTSSIPQYQLQVYALAQTAGRYVAAGTASIDHLGTGARAALRIRLLGRAAGSRLTFEAPPTIFG
jgi:hypothetical protein